LAEIVQAHLQIDTQGRERNDRKSQSHILSGSCSRRSYLGTAFYPIRSNSSCAVYLFCYREPIYTEAKAIGMTRNEEYVRFTVSREEWAEFELPDGTILRAKFVLTTVLREKAAIGEYSIKSNNVVGLIVPEKYLGEPVVAKSYTTEEVAAAVEEDWVDGIKTKTPDQWNVYALDDGAIVSVKLELLGAGRTSLYDPKGERVYTYNLQPIVKIKIPPELRKRLAEKKAPLVLLV